MAIYHLSVKTISRSAGRSATAAAAYRSGVRIVDERTGEIHDYTRKGGIESTDLVLPEGPFAWAENREVLWNTAEQAEKRKNSTVAREFEIALPAELTSEQRRGLALKFAAELAERHRCAVDVSIHAPGREGDNRNHHAHILTTTRRLGWEGMDEKCRELDDLKTGEVQRWRQRWAEVTNAYLKLHGYDQRIDHRSHAERGLMKELAGIHVGPTASAIERKGRVSERGERNRAIQAAAAKLSEVSIEHRGVVRDIQTHREQQAAKARQHQVDQAAAVARVEPSMEEVAAAWERSLQKHTAARRERLQRLQVKAQARQARRTAKAEALHLQRQKEPGALTLLFKLEKYQQQERLWERSFAAIKKLAGQAEGLCRGIAAAIWNARDEMEKRIVRKNPEVAQRLQRHVRDKEEQRIAHLVEQRKKREAERALSRGRGR